MSSQPRRRRPSEDGGCPAPFSPGRRFSRLPLPPQSRPPFRPEHHPPPPLRAPQQRSGAGDGSGALPLRSGLRRAAPGGAGEAGAGRGRPFPPPREEVTWRRRRGGKARGALFFPEPPGGWSLAAPPEPAASRRVQTSGSWCGSAAAPPPARSRRLSAARMPRPGGARYVLFPWRPASSSGVRPPFSSRRAAPFGKTDKPQHNRPPRRAIAARRGAGSRRRGVRARRGGAGGGLRTEVP
ncbi:proline-rich protein HaeIII subfamily 1-like [Harpia harpyja]|uniref:proline-rich protein HaeIII subfamily 1-like n=1 Tax=Harpia harpyja TaxID=202280 RepID=UPI0022B14642|nr:proline-rich protein HaeIII subfamily 1-like [Harpia harpyja]